MKKQMTEKELRIEVRRLVDELIDHIIAIKKINKKHK